MEGEPSLTERALRLRDEDDDDSKGLESKRDQENFISKNIRTASKSDKIYKIKLLYRAILKDQEIQHAQNFRNKNQILETEVNLLKSKRWDDFKLRRLEAYKNYIAVIKKIKNMKTFILHIKIRDILKTFHQIFLKKIKMKKNMLARGFISIKLLLTVIRKSRRYLDDRTVPTRVALMVKFKNYIRYSFMMATMVQNHGFNALNDPKMQMKPGTLVRY